MTPGATRHGRLLSGELELVVPYTDPDLARALLNRAVLLTAGLQARISLVAVHAVPFPADFRCPTSTHAFLVNQLIELAAECPLPVIPQVVLARSREEGFRYALRPESTVLVAPIAISGAPGGAPGAQTARRRPQSGFAAHRKGINMLDVFFVLITLRFSP